MEENIMSFQHRELKLFGVQFHPESIITEFGKELMENFLEV
jgi:anthranilate/para-aminobenzoate synthase component II